MKRLIFLLAIGISLMSCVTTRHSTIITGTIRPAINPSEVRIFADPPAEFETIAVIDATRNIEFSNRQRTQDRVIKELKYQASRIGANGIVLMGAGSQTSGGVVINNIIVPTEAVTTQVRAIYVIRE
jgi:hypothetical protein